MLAASAHLMAVAHSFDWVDFVARLAEAYYRRLCSRLVGFVIELACQADFVQSITEKILKTDHKH